MVDSIRQTNRIGIIKPPGLPRPVEERNSPRHGRHDQDREESSSDREEPSVAPGGQIEPATENEDRPQTGHRIDVRI